MKLPSRCQNIANDLTALKDLMEEALRHSAQETSLESDLIGKRLRIRVPGSCANLGSGFDVFGIAVSLYLTADMEVLERKVCHVHVHVSAPKFTPFFVRQVNRLSSSHLRVKAKEVCL